MEHCNTQKQAEKTVSMLRSWASYLRQTLVFMRNRALRERFNFCFLGVF